jgi:drug/metabolite transporter (DMT)-like permease
MKTSSKPKEKDRLISNKLHKQTNYINVQSLEEDIDEKDIETSSSKEDNGSTLLIAFFLMLFFQLGNRIFGRLQTYPMHNYPIFMSFLCVVIYIPICFLYIIPMISFTSVISKEQQEIPKYKFAVMGAYDSLAGIMQTFAINYITNSGLIVLVQQSAIPISMAISKIALQAQYTNAQYLGAFVVLFGIVLVLIPTLIANNNVNTESTSDEATQLAWIFVLIISCVPMCLSSVYKEKALGETEIDVVYLNGWVAIFQFLIAIPLCVPSAQVINMSVNEIIPNIVGGAYCWMGINTITENDDMVKADSCSQAPLFVTTYLVFNVVYNILIVVILKHGSANILWMASTAIVPLSNVAFSLNIMPGHQPLKIWDIIGLFVIMFGLVLYRFMNSITSCFAGKSDEDDSLSTVRAITKKAEAKQSKYVGFNQIEALNSLIDSRVMKERKVAFYRSPQQIRGSLLLRLGIPPSPHFTISPKTREMALSPTITQNPQNSNLLKKTTNIPVVNNSIKTNSHVISLSSSIPKQLSSNRVQQMVTNTKTANITKGKDSKPNSAKKPKSTYSNEV